MERIILSWQQPYLSWDCNLIAWIICVFDSPGTPELFEHPLSCFLMSQPQNSLCLDCFRSHITAPNLAVRPSEDREKTLEPSMFLSWQGLEPGLGEKMWRGVVSLLFSVWYGYLIQKKASLWWGFYWEKFFNNPFILKGGAKCVLGHQSPLLQPMFWTGG